MTETNISVLVEHATRFQQAILNSDLKQLPISLQRFPFGSCGDTSPLLGEYFFQSNLGQFDYVSGVNRTHGSHAWIEQNGIIVDITAYQFPEVIIPVIVTESREWHRRFKHSSKGPARIEVYDPITTRMLTRAYQTISKLLTKPTLRVD